MSDRFKDPSLDEFINSFNRQLDQVISKNAENLHEILKKDDPLVTKTVRSVYNDFFGSGSQPTSGKGTPVKGASHGYTPVHRAHGPGGPVPGMPGASGRTGTSGIPGMPGANEPFMPGGSGAATDGLLPVETSNGKTLENAQAQEAPKVPEKSGMEQLRELVGLKNIKHDVAELVALAKVRKMREEKGLKFVPTSLHLVFAGNPGTGKTTVARILAQLYKEIGILSKGQLVEVDRSGLVAGFVGQTAIKTQEKIQEAMGGILFVDEAYALSRVEGNDFGQEAIDTILKAMEDHRDDFIVIVAGYTDLMEDFIDSNPGLKSRFNKYFFFEDYTAEELMSIFESNCKKYSYTITDESKEAVRKRIEEAVENKDENFANAREVRNIFEEIITNQATRVAGMESPTEEDLTTILPEDLEDGGIEDADAALARALGEEVPKKEEEKEDTDKTE